MHSLPSPDVVIVGAGPAGAWAAYTLARRGVRVTIFDPTHPREKPCGGGISGRALAYCAAAIGHLNLPASPIHRVRFVDTLGDRSAVVPLDAVGPTAYVSALVVASRTTFDAALLAAARRAGATLTPVRVFDVS